MTKKIRIHAAIALAVALLWPPAHAAADGDLAKAHHIILVMQENHSFDNYFGVLPYVDGSPYHPGKRRGGCDPTDHSCVDGLSCRTKRGELVCSNSNPSNFPGRVRSFHDPRWCTGPDLDHSWDGSHREGNYKRPNAMDRSSPNNGFVRVNAETEGQQALLHDTMGWYDDGDLPFYYGLAKTFAISDRYFADVIGQTFPNRAYFAAATSFGHLTTNEIITPGGYKPITGTIYDRLDAAGVSWTNYYSVLPFSLIFATSPGHTKPLAQFATDAAAGTLAQVVFIDSSPFVDQPINGVNYETDEHPPADIRAGEWFVSNLVTALRNSPSWNDSILILTYDEHGGFYDHVAPPLADQGGASTPDGIAPGQCADLSNPPASLQPGGGVSCTHSATVDAPGICPTFTPTGPYPSDCATFDQLGFRLPFVAISPFAKPHYVSHSAASHSSVLALLEKRFGLEPMTARDARSHDLEDLFDFDHAPSATAAVTLAPPPTSTDPGCPFVGSGGGGL